MELLRRKKITIFTPKTSLRKRVAYSLAIVRLILAPVILLAVYYLLAMGWIMDRIVSVDAPAATLAQQASIQMLEARRAERNYFLLRDPAYLKENHDALESVSTVLNQILALEPEERTTTQQALDAVNVYRQRFSAATAAMAQPGKATLDRIQAVVQAYETNLNDLFRKNRLKSRQELVDQLRDQVGSFDAQITATVQSGDPLLKQVAADMETSSRQIFQLTSELESRNWQRVQDDHRRARVLLRRAEWVLSIVSVLVLLLSVWFSFVLPREVVKPLISLREAVDNVASGNYAVEFELQGKGEVLDLARSVHNLILHIPQVRQTA